MEILLRSAEIVERELGLVARCEMTGDADLPTIRRGAEQSLDLLYGDGYFAPGQRVPDIDEVALEALAEETHELTSNDVLPAQAGYSNYRRALLEAGVTLYELKPSGPGRDGKVRIRDALGGSSRAALHETSFVIDRGTVFVGSLNLDPRSVKVNTEVGALVRSEALAADVAAIFDRNAAPQSAWRVVLHEGRIVGRTILVP